MINRLVLMMHLYAVLKNGIDQGQETGLVRKSETDAWLRWEEWVTRPVHCCPLSGK